MQRICFGLLLVWFPLIAWSATPAPEKEWTFLIYLNGHNNLDRYGKEDINEMEQVGSTDKINVVVQWASSENSKTKRLYVKKDNSPDVVKSPVIQEMPRVDMGDWRNLVEFAKWGAERYPAKHYFVDVWNHGSGWRLKQKLRSQNLSAMDISFDDISGNAISTVELGQAMKEISRSIGKKIDIYGSDACLMAMVEVSSEMASSVNYFVGSQDLEPGDGWPYDDFLKHWNQLKEATPAQVSKQLVIDYVKSYQAGSQGSADATLSAYDLSQSGQFQQAVTELGLLLKTLDTQSRGRLVEIIKQTFTFAYSDYADFGSFLSKLKSSDLLKGKNELLDRVLKAEQDLVIANQDTASFAEATGVAIWLPNSSGVFGNYEDRYRALNFDKKTGWADVLQSILN